MCEATRAQLDSSAKAPAATEIAIADLARDASDFSAKRETSQSRSAEASRVEMSRAVVGVWGPGIASNDARTFLARLANGNVNVSHRLTVCEQLGRSTSAQDHGHLGGLLAGKIGSNRFVAQYAVDGRAK